MNWSGRRVAVTGAGGFIGSHLSERLLSLGAQVTGLVHGDARYRAGYLAEAQAQFPAQLNVAGGDMRDATFVRAALDGADTVFHLAAVTSVAYSYANPEETILTNTLGSLNVCSAAREHGVRRLVHTSTAGVYGNAADGAPITEAHSVVAANPYTAGKLAGDFVAQTFHLSYGLPVATIRLFNAYGPRMGRYLIMPTIIEQLLQGPELRLGDLSPSRPFTFVDDIVDGLVAAAERDEAVGELIHLGNESSMTMAELVEQVAAALGTPYTLVQDPARLRPKKSEIYVVRVNSAKAREKLGWEARTPFAAGLSRTIAWVQAGGYNR